MAQVVADRKRCAIVYSPRIAVLRGLNIPMHQEAINKQTRFLESYPAGFGPPIHYRSLFSPRTMTIPRMTSQMHDTAVLYSSAYQYSGDDVTRHGNDENVRRVQEEQRRRVLTIFGRTDVYVCSIIITKWIIAKTKFIELRSKDYSLNTLL